MHPSAQTMGYGSEAISQFINILQKSTANLWNDENIFIKIKNNSVFFNLANLIETPKISWIGASFGLSEKLFSFWSKNQFKPICARQVASKSTGDYPAIVVRSLGDNFINSKIENMNLLFISRFIPLLSYSFNNLLPTLCLSIIQSSDNRKCALKKILFSKNDMDRLTLFSKGLVSIRNILDIIPDISRHYFMSHDIRRLPVLHQSILVMLGCQHKSISFICKNFQLEEFHINSLLSKIINTVLSELIVE